MPKSPFQVYSGLSLVGLLVLQVACAPAPAPHKDPFEEGDADVDADADADADNSAGDVELHLTRDDAPRYVERLTERSSAGVAAIEGSELSGVIQYASALDSVVQCDFEASFKGVEYTGDCPDCEWAFEVYDWAIVADRSGPDCVSDPHVSLEPPAPSIGMVLAFKPVYELSYYYYEYGEEPYGGVRTVYNVLQTGYAYGAPYDIGPYSMWTLAFDGSRYGSMSRDGDDFAWSWGQSYTRTESVEDLWSYCGYYDWSDSVGALYMGDTTETEDLPCGTFVVDAWSFDAEAGEEYTLTVDTLAAETSGSAYIYVAGESSCLEGAAYGLVACSHGSVNCPSMRLTLEESGEHTAYISVGSCRDSDRFEYVLDVQQSVR